MGYLVTVGRYRAITGDNATDAPSVSANIEAAQELLAEDLDRPLDEAERTETMHPTRDGMLWPRATPIVDAGTYTVDGLGLRGSYPFGVPGLIDGTCGVDVTYTGGWVERTANPTAANRLPAHIERDLAWAAHALREPDAAGMTQFPAGARAVSLGDASVTFGPDGAPRPADERPQWSRRTLAYRYRVIGTARCCP